MRDTYSAVGWETELGFKHADATMASWQHGLH